MYLTKLTLNLRCRETRRDMQSPYELHRTLARAFTTEPSVDYRAQHGVLFRSEPLAHAAVLPTVLVQSNSVPDWNELPEAYLLSANVRPFDPVFTTGQTLSFRIVANPTKKEKRPGQRQGRRVALTDVADELYKSDDDNLQTPATAWLTRKGILHGFQVLYATTDAFWLGTFDRDKSTVKNQLPIYGVRYDGLLQVTDPALLLDAVSKGIGPSKAFGFGLLSVARHR